MVKVSKAAAEYVRNKCPDAVIYICSKRKRSGGKTYLVDEMPSSLAAVREYEKLINVVFDSSQPKNN